MTGGVLPGKLTSGAIVGTIVETGVLKKKQEGSGIQWKAGEACDVLMQIRIVGQRSFEDLIVKQYRSHLQS